RILKPVLPEIEGQALRDLRATIAAEREAGIKPDALRRLAALLPRDTRVAEDIAGRLRLSNKARKRLGCIAEPDSGKSPETLAYRIGVQCAADRFLLAGRAAEARAIAAWHAPRLPIGGGALIKRGLDEGPQVAKTLREIEDRWVEQGFPVGDGFDRIVEQALEKTR
ncbi:MAG: CCA tRNA nucleotidyltransferase, partial [Sphingomonas sp.]|nr:CCA tRNA nucleotidyltransferase [Sphingomonas sp.]